MSAYHGVKDSHGLLYGVTNTRGLGNFGLMVDIENEFFFRPYLVNHVRVAQLFYPSEELEV